MSDINLLTGDDGDTIDGTIDSLGTTRTDTALEIPRELALAAKEDTPVVEPRMQKRVRERRARRAAARWWYRMMRGNKARKCAHRLRWDHAVERPGLTSSTQCGALSPLLTPTRPVIVGPLLGQDEFTKQPVTHSLQGLYALGIIKSTNAVVLGGIGSAKSTLVKTHYILRGITMDDQRVVVFDRKRQARDGGTTEGEYVRVASLVDSQVISLSREGANATRINILDPIITVETANNDETSTVGQDYLLGMVAEAAKESPLTAEERWALSTAHKGALRTAKSEGRVAVLSDVVRALYSPQDSDIPGPMGDEQKLLLERGIVNVNRVTEWGLGLALALERFLDGDLSGLLDGETHIKTEDGRAMLDADLVVIDTSALPEGSLALSLMMMVFSTYLMSVWVTMPGYKTLILEEGYSAAGGKIETVPLIFREIVKRSRGVGATVVSVFHHISDVPKDSPLQSVIRESGVQHIFVQDRGDDCLDIVEMFSLPDTMVQTIQLLPTGTHVLCRGKLPHTIVTGFRTRLDRWAAFTDNAMRAHL